MANALTMLEKDHRRVERLLGQLAKSKPGPDRERAVEQLASALEVHMRFEESEIYPLLQQLDREMEQEAETEHVLGRDGVAKLRQLAAKPGFLAAVDMVTAGIAHHVADEEGKAFPKLRKSTDAMTLDELGRVLVEQKRANNLLDAELADATKADLLELAKDAGVEGRTKMSASQLRAALLRS